MLASNPSTMKIRDKNYICCTSDQCKNCTTLHLYIGQMPPHAGGGWYQCLKCGVFRQDIRHSSPGVSNSKINS